MNRISAAIAAASALTALTAAPAMAHETKSVSYANLDLGTEEGARAMLARINEAARDVCRSHDGRMSVSERRMVRVCVAEATEQTVAQLNSPTVTAMFEGRTPAIVIAQR